MKLGARIRLAWQIVFGRKVELVYYEDGYEVATAEMVMLRILTERKQVEPELSVDYWTVESNWRVHVPCWFEGSVKAPGLAIVHQAIRQTVAVIRWG